MTNKSEKGKIELGNEEWEYIMTLKYLQNSNVYRNIKGEIGVERESSYLTKPTAEEEKIIQKELDEIVADMLPTCDW